MGLMREVAYSTAKVGLVLMRAGSLEFKSQAVSEAMASERVNTRTTAGARRQFMEGVLRKVQVV